MKKYTIILLLALLLASACRTNPAIIKPKKIVGQPFQTNTYLNGHVVQSVNVVLVQPPKIEEVVIIKGEFTDERDGQVYHWAKVGKQVWMTQNVNYKTKAHSWAYNSDEETAKTNGRLYAFDALLEACPKGWHVPTDTEWMQLERGMGMRYDETGLLGSRSTVATQFLPGYAIGFDLLYSGFYKAGKFTDTDKAAYFWSSTGYGIPIADRVFKKGKNGIYRYTVNRECGLSLRCVKNYWEDK